MRKCVGNRINNLLIKIFVFPVRFQQSDRRKMASGKGCVAPSAYIEPDLPKSGNYKYIITARLSWGCMSLDVYEYDVQ